MVETEALICCKRWREAYLFHKKEKLMVIYCLHKGALLNLCVGGREGKI